jgi:16S rRNA (cytosine1402-N4)-methyltransferase
MAGTGDFAGHGRPDADGGPARHTPVLLQEVLDALQPGAGKAILDGTFGAGGYTTALLERGADVIAMDRDPGAIAGGQLLVDAWNGKLSLHQSRFSLLDQFAPEGGLDGVVLDIGVSSMQIDEADRGFSFQKDGPLDMRMERAGVSAADVVNKLKAGDLARIFGFLGEERQAGRIARAIEKRRAEEPFSTTRDLARLIETVTPRKAKDKIHPATRVFQALRIYVNDELGELVAALIAAERALKPGGRLAVVTFHSLEDHLPQVELIAATFLPVGKGLVTPGDEELSDNPRARSAKLRSGQRTEAQAQRADMSVFGLPDLAELDAIGG